MGVRLAVLLSICGLGVSCADPDTTPADASADSSVDGSTVDGGDLEWPAPIPPALPNLGPCPHGWRGLTVGGALVCDPWPEGGALDCPSHQAHFPGEPGCSDVGSACPEGEWPADLPSEGVTYVADDAPEGGSGTRAAPFATLADAVTAAPAGTIVALSAGTHEAGSRLTRSVVIRGACAAATVLESEIETPILWAGEGLEVELRDLSLRSTVGQTLSGQNAILTLRGVSLHRIAIDAAGGRTLLEEVVVRETTSSMWAAIVTSLDAELSASRVEVRDSATRGARFGGSSAVVVRDMVVRRSAREGIHAGSGNVDLGRVVVEDSVLGGVAFFGEGTATDLVVQDVRLQGEAGAGIVAFETTRIERAHVRGSEGHGVLALEGTVTLSDVVIEGPGDADAKPGRGIEVGLSARLVANRVLISRAHDMGLFVTDSGTVVEAEDLTIGDVGLNRRGLFGRGVHVQSGAIAQMERVSLRRCHEVALSSSDGSQVTIRSLSVDETRSRPCVEGCGTPAAGIGLLAFPSARIDVTRIRVAWSALCAIQIVEGGSLDLRDGIVEHNPIGVNVQDPSFNVERLMDTVFFRNNETNLDATALPVPSPVPPTT